MSRVVIDTNAYSFMCRGRMDVAKLLAGYDEVLVPSVVLGELEAGFRHGSHYAMNKSGLQRFLAIDRVRIVDVDSDVAETYGRLYAELRDGGTMIPLNDVWIASAAVTLDAPLVTFDGHFSHIGGLNLVLLDV